MGHFDPTYRFNLDDDDVCRFCNSDVESPEHLLFECGRFLDLLNDSVEELEVKSKFIVTEIYKLES